jgi:hypothetical protein
LSYAQFATNAKENNNEIAKGWIIKKERGGSYLPCPLTREDMILDITDIITLLNRVKGNLHAFHWKNQM